MGEAGAQRRLRDLSAGRCYEVTSARQASKFLSLGAEKMLLA